MDKFASMGKNELRAACKEAGISYGKLNNDGMRDALRGRELAAQVAARAAYDAKRERIASTEYTDEQLTEIGVNGVEAEEGDELGYCPHCGCHLSNGMWTYDDANAQQKRLFTRVYECLGCGESWGPMVDHAKTEDRHTGTGLKIEKNREKRNGVTRPSAGGKCREIWDFLDAMYQDGKGTTPTAKQVKDEAAVQGWNANNASIEFYQWRKFNGISGRK